MNNREIEKKYRIFPNGSLVDLLNTAYSILRGKVDFTEHEYGMDVDTYWVLEDFADYTTLRVRRSQEGNGELTLKSRDSSSNLNRMEENVYLSDPEKARKMMYMVHGPHATEISKIFYKWKFNGGELVVYRIVGRHDDTYLEIEGPSEKFVLDIGKTLEKQLKKQGIALQTETKSMSELYKR